MIVVDTSVWIDFFDHPRSDYAKELKNMLVKDEDICLVDIIVTEILQGIKSDKIFDEIKEYLANFIIIRPDSLEIYIKAAEIYRHCSRQGKTISKTVDTIIASVAIQNNLPLFHKDKDFDTIASCTDLKIHKP